MIATSQRALNCVSEDLAPYNYKSLIIIIVYTRLLVMVYRYFQSGRHTSVLSRRKTVLHWNMELCSVRLYILSNLIFSCEHQHIPSLNWMEICQWIILIYIYIFFFLMFSVLCNLAQIMYDKQLSLPSACLCRSCVSLIVYILFFFSSPNKGGHTVYPSQSIKTTCKPPPAPPPPPPRPR